MDESMKERMQAQEDDLYMKRVRGEISSEEFQCRLADLEQRFDRAEFMLKIMEINKRRYR